MLQTHTCKTFTSPLTRHMFKGMFGRVSAGLDIFGRLPRFQASLPRSTEETRGARCTFPPAAVADLVADHHLVAAASAQLPHLGNIAASCHHWWGGKIANFQGKTSPKEGGLGGQSLPELGRGSLPEENQLSRQLSQLENWRAVAARVRHDGADSVEVDGPGSRATDTHGSMAPWYMEEQLPWLRLVGPGDRSKATSFS